MGSEIIQDRVKLLFNIKRELEDDLEVLCHKIASNRFQKILFNCEVLLDNCVDENSDVLDFNPTIKAGFEAIELLKDVSTKIDNDQDVLNTEMNEKIKLLLSKVH